MAVEKKPLYLNNGSFMNFMTPLLILGYLLSLWFIASGKLVSEGNYALICKLIGVLWVLGPPLWLYVEQANYFPRHGNPDAGFAQLKVHQDALARLWLAAVVVLAALFVGTGPH